MPTSNPSLFDTVESPPLLMIIDGHAMVFRAWFALHQQTMTLRSTGQEVKGVYGFTSMFFKALADRQPTHVAITFDAPGPTFRHEEFEQYKAQRPEAPPEAFGDPVMRVAICWWLLRWIPASRPWSLKSPGFRETARRRVRCR